MLVLTRKVGEQVVVGDGIRVMVVSVKGEKVRLGFTAPPDVPVHREEVYREIRQSGHWNVTAARRPREQPSDADALKLSCS